MKLLKCLGFFVVFLFASEVPVHAWSDCDGFEPVCGYGEKAVCVKFNSGDTKWACVEDRNNANLFVDSGSRGYQDGARSKAGFASFLDGMLKGADDSQRYRNRRRQNQ